MTSALADAALDGEQERKTHETSGIERKSDAFRGLWDWGGETLADALDIATSGRRERGMQKYIVNGQTE
eukprot:8687428-Pyramimonas_sp.AAC.1